MQSKVQVLRVSAVHKQGCSLLTANTLALVVVLVPVLPFVCSFDGRVRFVHNVADLVELIAVLARFERIFLRLRLLLEHSHQPVVVLMPLLLQHVVALPSTPGTAQGLLRVSLTKIRLPFAGSTVARKTVPNVQLVHTGLLVLLHESLLASVI